MTTEEIMDMALDLIEEPALTFVEKHAELRAAIEAALTNAYAEGRKDQAEELLACATCGSLAEPADNIAKLREFAQGCLKDWPDVGMDGFDLQELGVKTGMLVGTQVFEPCGEGCNCASYHDGAEVMAEGVICYRKTELLKGKP